jgi:hypothetical protein
LTASGRRWKSTPSLFGLGRSNRTLEKKNMSKNLYWFAFGIAVISGLAGASFGPEIAGIANFLLIGAGAWIGWTCVRSSQAKDYAIGAAALVFLNHSGWGDAGSTLAALPWIGTQVAAMFGNLVNLVLVIAAVGMLKNLTDTAQESATSAA